MFTFAHFSDPHLPLPPVRWGDLAGKRLTGYLNWGRNRRVMHDPAVLGRLVAHVKASVAEHIAITGDFANIALPAEFESARDWLTAMGPPHDVTIIPGNHDVYVPGALEMMRDVLGASMRGDDGNEGFPFLRRRGPLALVAVNTGVPTAPFLATGKLGKRQLEALARMLSDLKRERLFRVVLIHHPPESERAWHKRLSDAPGFRRVISAQGAELILHGHDHIHELHWLPGPDGRVPAVGVPSASGAPGLAPSPAAYNLYRIDGAPGAWRCEMETHEIGEDGKFLAPRRTPLVG